MNQVSTKFTNNSGFALAWPELIERNDQKADNIVVYF